MQLKEAIENKNQLLGRSISLEGFLYLDRKSQYLVSEEHELGDQAKGIPILDQGLGDALEGKVSAWLGGALYQDHVEITAIIVESNDVNYPFALKGISRMKLIRRGEIFEIY